MARLSYAPKTLNACTLWWPANHGIKPTEYSGLSRTLDAFLEDRMQITCASCGDVIDIPPELLGDDPDITRLEPYICDACETRRDDAADELDHILHGV